MNRPGFLWSYFYFRPGGSRGSTDPSALMRDTFGEPVPNVFLDSGAFSAYTQGVPIKVETYADYLEQHSQHFAAYANLDVKGDVDAGVKNLAYLRRRGLDPLPVFHGGEDFKLLEEFCESSDYVALGGIAGASVSIKDKKVLGWLQRCFTIANRHGTGLHGFGLSSYPVLGAFPWKSADSTSWHAGIRYGQVRLFDHYRGRWVSFKSDDLRSWRKYGWLVREHGFIPEAYGDLRRIDSGRPEVVKLLAGSWTAAAETLARRNPGFRLYLVDDNPQHQRWANEGVEQWMQRDTQPSAAA